MASTRNCVICGEPANGFAGGHVHKDKQKIIARFCSKECFHSPTLPGCTGCHGKWLMNMGIDDSFGEVMYIDPDGLHKL